MVVVGQVIFLVGRVDVVVGQPGAHEDDRRVQLAIEERANRDRAAFTLKDGRASPFLLQRRSAARM